MKIKKRGTMMKINKGLIIMLIISLCLFGMTACNGEKPNETIQYEQINAEKAKEIMDNETDYIIVDARTQEEFDENYPIKTN